MMSSGPIKPIFIVGSPRSGTTLLRFMLSSHPDIYIPDETGFIPYLLKPSQVEQPLSLFQVEHLISKIGQLNYLWKDLVPDLKIFYLNLPEPTLTHLLHALYCQMIAPFSATRWGDKTPLYVRHMPILRRIFPQAQFIHLIRDGRDATLSAQQKWGLNEHWYMDNYYLLKNWVDNVTIGREAGAKLSDEQYLEIRYEQLVQSPENILQNVCDFLGESYQEEMLHQNYLAQQVGPGPDGHTEVMQPISQGSLQRWKSQMSAFDLKLADRIAGSLLEDLTYESSISGRFRLSELPCFWFLGIKYIFSSSMRKILYSTGILTLNRNLRTPDSVD